jgi:hypothetical protein
MTNLPQAASPSASDDETLRHAVSANTGAGGLNGGVCPSCCAERPYSSLVVGWACCFSSPWRHGRPILVSVLNSRRGRTPNGQGPLTCMLPFSLHRTRFGVFAPPCCAVTAEWRGVARNVTRPRRRCAAARRTAISMKNPWEATSVAANDERSAYIAVPPAFLSHTGSPRQCADNLNKGATTLIPHTRCRQENPEWRDFRL